MGTLLLPIGFILLIWLFLFRPQQKRMKAQRELMSALEVGDEVLTSAGIYGYIEEFDEGTVFLRVSDTTTLKISRSSISQRITYKEDWDAETPEYEEGIEDPDTEK